MNDHGTGCSLASAIAAGLARALVTEEYRQERSTKHGSAEYEQGGPRLWFVQALTRAVIAGVGFVQVAMQAAGNVKIGEGHGPLLHCAGRELACSGTFEY